MIMIKYELVDSSINLAGKGIAAAENIKKGRAVSAPDSIEKLYSLNEIKSLPEDSIEYSSSVRWFEDYYSAVSKWSDECYYNHSFEPNCLWHLGFVFALRDISRGEELTIDYSFLLGEGQYSMFEDSKSRKLVRGLSYRESLLNSAKKLVEIFE